MAAFASPPAEQRLPDQLMSMSLKELMSLEVTTLSKKPQQISQIGAAVFVVTSEDIRRSSANSIPEVLRMVPGLQVARIDSNKWAITSRGFNGRFADDLLVMFDGRTVYSPLFAGVSWEAQDYPLEDIERIEVIRGPGGTLWGGNAVNGVINVITKKAAHTQGGLMTVGGGTEERGFGTLRYGGEVNPNLHVRAYGKMFERDASYNPKGAHDDWRMGRGGFRMDWDPTARDAVTVQGDYYRGTAGQQTFIPSLTAPSFSSAIVEDVRLSGGNLLGRWQHSFSETSNLTVQTYLDHSRRNERLFAEERTTYDLDLQHRFSLPLNQDLVWGFGYRASNDDLRNSSTMAFNPAQESLRTIRAFVQDEIRFWDDRLRFSVGTNFIKYTYSANFFQPNARLVWNINHDHSVWASVTRAHRFPSRFDHDGFQREGVTDGEFMTFYGNPRLQSERLWGYEIGFRGQIHSRLSLDLAAYYNRYSHSSGDKDISELLSIAASDIRTLTYGFEIAADWRVNDGWRLVPSFSYLHTRQQIPIGQEAEERGEDPAYQFSLRSLMNITRDLEFDSNFRFIDRLPGVGVGSYVNLDLRLGWRLTHDVELSLVGQSLLENHHPEFIPEVIPTARAQIQRGVFAKLTWKF